MSAASQKVSVVILTQDSLGSVVKSRQLDNCIYSLLHQVYPDWECIIVDNAATPGFREQALKLTALNPSSVKYAKADYSHISLALNAGINASQGEFIFPMRADDTLDPHALVKLVSLLQAEPKLGLAYCCVEVLGEGVDQKIVWVPGPAYEHGLPFENTIPSTSLFRKSLFDQGIAYRQVLNCDWDLILQMMVVGYSWKYCPEFLIQRKSRVDLSWSKDRSHHYQTLAQNVLGNPTLYPEVLKPWANSMLSKAPDSLNQPTILFLPRPSSSIYRKWDGKVACLAREFFELGCFISAIGSYPSDDMGPAGTLLVSNSNDELETILPEVSKMGSSLIVFTDRDASEVVIFKELENVKALVFLTSENQQESNANFDLDVRLRDSDCELRQIGKTETPLVFESQQDLAQKILSLYVSCQDKKGHSQEVFDNTLQSLSSRDFSDSTTALKETAFNEKESPTLSVVIPSRNVDPTRMERCLHSIRQSYHSESVQILVSDYGSSRSFLDDLSQLCVKYQAKLIASQTRALWSRSRVLNIAIRHCNTDWILFTDADMVFSPELITMWRHYQAELGERIMYLCQCKKLPPLADLPTVIEADQYKKISERGRLFDTYGQGGCQILRTEWLKKVRGFNEDYLIWGAEDNDLSFRAGLDDIKAIWMQPGKLLHQWHIKAVPSDWRDKNRETFGQLRANPRLVVNDKDWGMIKEDEQAEYNRLGPLQPKSDPESSLFEKQLFDPTVTDSKRVKLLLAWANKALNQSQDEVALETFEDVLALEQHNIDALLGIAKVHFARRTMSRAGQLALEVIRKDSNNLAAKELVEKVVNQSPLQAR